MRLSSRSFPYPVVGNRDDVPGAAFQATLEMTAGNQNVYVDVGIACSSATILELISSGVASYVVHVECSNTLFRRAFEFSTATHQIAIPADQLNDSVEINAFARAVQPAGSYVVQKAHPDYDRAEFSIAAGDILAVAEGQVFYVEPSFDALKNIGSIMQIQEFTEDGDHPMQVDLEKDKILVVLSKADFALYKRLRAHEAVASSLSSIIVLPVLMDAIRELQTGGDSDLRWRKRLHHRIASLGLSMQSEPLELAQRVLELPLKRALAASRTMVEADAA